MESTTWIAMCRLCHMYVQYVQRSSSQLQAVQIGSVHIHTHTPVILALCVLKGARPATPKGKVAQSHTQGKGGGPRWRGETSQFTPKAKAAQSHTHAPWEWWRGPRYRLRGETLRAHASNVHTSASKQTPDRRDPDRTGSRPTHDSGQTQISHTHPTVLSSLYNPTDHFPFTGWVSL